MSLFLSRFLHCVALALFTVTGAAVASLHLYVGLTVSWLRNDSPPKVRFLVDEWQSRWGAWWYWLCTKIGRIDVKIHIDKSVYEHGDGPFIIWGNHYGAFDVILVGHILRTLCGIARYRPVAKAMIEKIPIIGRAWAKTSGFMQRDGKSGDLDAVSALARMVRADGAHALIYPEGTVLTKDTATRGNRTLLPKLKHRGIRLLTRGLPGYKHLCVTMYWEDFSPWWFSDTGAVPPGRRLKVDVRVLPAMPEDATDADISAMLIAQFEKMQQWLDAQPPAAGDAAAAALHA